MSLKWMKTDCGDAAMPCYDTSHPAEAHHHVRVLGAHKNLAFGCDGSSECAWERGSGTLYVSHTPAGYWSDEPGEWMRDDVRAEIEEQA